MVSSCGIFLPEQVNSPSNAALSSAGFAAKSGLVRVVRVAACLGFFAALVAPQAFATVLERTRNTGVQNQKRDELAPRGFVTVRGTLLERDGRPYSFVGANFWQGMNLGASDSTGNRPQLLRELDRMQSIGIRNLRIFALSEGPENAPYRVVPSVQPSPGQFNEALLEGLDFLLAEMSKRDMTAVVCLGNFWPWSGGMAQWVSWDDGSAIPYPPPHPGGSWAVFQEYSSRFYAKPRAIRAYQDSVRKIVTRINTITGRPYAKDPTIMAWQLANEPRGSSRRTEFLAWVRSTAKLIKSLDSKHLVSLGSEGQTLDPASAGNDFVADHSIPGIDYTTIHLWLENWGAYQPLQAETSLPTALQIMKFYVGDHVLQSRKLRKPIVLEEFGLARDLRSMDPQSTTRSRDRYFKEAFELTLQSIRRGDALVGANFWAWSGESLPSVPYGSLWRPGDSLLGDPPHEEQGWYGVYSSDASTLQLIGSFSSQIQKARMSSSVESSESKMLYQP